MRSASFGFRIFARRFASTGEPGIEFFKCEFTKIARTNNVEKAGSSRELATRVSLNAPATFGKIRTARDMRRIQLGARLSF